MTPLIHPRLVNDPFGDPALYLEFTFARRAMLFDMGDLHNLSGRDLPRIRHTFVSHAHMDHFAGLDRQLRVCLGRLAYRAGVRRMVPVHFSPRHEGRADSLRREAEQAFLGTSNARGHA